MSQRQIDSEWRHRSHHLHDLCRTLEKVLNSLGIVEDNASNAVLQVFDEWEPGKAQGVEAQLEAMQAEWMQQFYCDMLGCWYWANIPFLASKDH